MLIILVCLINCILALRFGEWRNWKKYQSTILYLITSDLLYNFICYNYPLWQYESKIPILNHTLLNLIVLFIGYPSFIILYLSRFPSTRSKQILWVSLWATYWSLDEWLNLKMGEFSYHNGWNFMWTVLFNFAMYSMLWLHYKKPLMTYLFSIIASVGLIIIFKVPIWKMK